MSRGAQLFTQHQLTNAIKAAKESGVKDWRIEITDGRRKFIMVGGGSASTAKDKDDPDVNEWDDVK